MKKLLLIAAIATVFSVQAQARDGVEVYNTKCAMCHAAGAAGSPKTGDAAAWKPRLEKGMDGLVASAKKGLNAMPPMGMCMDCTDAEFKGAIEHMAKAK